MKKIEIILLLSFVIVGCNTATKNNKTATNVLRITNYSSFGETITDTDYVLSKEALARYKALEPGDTINLKFSANYGFFMPLDASGKEVIVAGKAFVTEVSVADLKHYAGDAGKSPDQIANISEPAMEFAFEAKGVLLKK